MEPRSSFCLGPWTKRSNRADHRWIRKKWKTFFCHLVWQFKGRESWKRKWNECFGGAYCLNQKESKRRIFAYLLALANPINNSTFKCVRNSNVLPRCQFANPFDHFTKCTMQLETDNWINSLADSLGNPGAKILLVPVIQSRIVKFINDNYISNLIKFESQIHLNWQSNQRRKKIQGNYNS